MRRPVLVTALATLAVVILASGLGLGGHHLTIRYRLHERVRALTGGGDPDLGRAALERRPCGGCHQIPGVHGARGRVGPSLGGLAGRVYIAGRLSNTPDNLEAWIVDPHAIDPGNAMPPTGVSPREARDMAAYLYTLN